MCIAICIIVEKGKCLYLNIQKREDGFQKTLFSKYNFVQSISHVYKSERQTKREGSIDHLEEYPSMMVLMLMNMKICKILLEDWNAYTD